MANRLLELEKALEGKRGLKATALMNRPFTRMSYARSVTLPAGTLERTKRFEGAITHMYLDTVGKVTVGVGRMLPDAAAAQKIAFVRNADSAAASQQEIADEFAAIKAKEAGKVASVYKASTTLHVTAATIDALLTDDLTNVVTGLQSKFPDYASYPENVQGALIDMAFNLGLHGLMTKFPTFVGLIKKKDFKGAAAESRRNGISDDRNSEIAKLLTSA
ncbi:glycoside hydrolase family protein [Solirubrobacter soli]|uniref:glycoside hydrolase family protein n=1 Tax=Solirubrobacter soli TaxID=363832 RepID=UPI00041E9A17|nr:glycoside hydrolase family protein [Solirubrobacter soli]